MHVIRTTTVILLVTLWIKKGVESRLKYAKELPFYLGKTLCIVSCGEPEFDRVGDRRTATFFIIIGMDVIL